MVHSLLVSTRIVGWIQCKLGRYRSFYRLIYNLIALITFIPLLIYTNRLDTDPVIRYSPPWNILQAILLISTVIVILLAFRVYDPLEFLGIRQIIGTPSSTPGKIVKTGLLGVVRHPMYLATIIFMWSLNATMADIVSRTILTLYIIVGTYLEERKLLAEYGEEYIEYQKQVPMLLPFKRNKER